MAWSARSWPKMLGLLSSDAVVSKPSPSGSHWQRRSRGLISRREIEAGARLVALVAMGKKPFYLSDRYDTDDAATGSIARKRTATSASASVDTVSNAAKLACAGMVSPNAASAGVPESASSVD